MTIKVDETFPSGVLRFKDDEGVKEIKTEEN